MVAVRLFFFIPRDVSKSLRVFRDSMYLFTNSSLFAYGAFGM